MNITIIKRSPQVMVLGIPWKGVTDWFSFMHHMCAKGGEGVTTVLFLRANQQGFCKEGGPLL